jgi:hypothetical protein
MPVTAVIQHRVADYDTWRKAYDGFAPVQEAAGVTHESVHRAAEDPNDILVLHRFGSLEAAESFFARQDLRETMHEGGVQGQPRIEIYQDA